MAKRWMAAAVAAAALAATTILGPIEWPGRVADVPDGTSRAESSGLSRAESRGVACPTNAKQANLDFTLKDTGGKAVTLSAYNGKVLLLDFWATWCLPCRVEIPVFVELYEKYKSKGFEVAGVVVLDEFRFARPFADRMKMNYTILDGVDREDLEAAFAPIPALPTSLLINREGKICRRHVGLPAMKAGVPIEQAVRDAFEAEIKALL